jgi:hypothetical protein
MQIKMDDSWQHRKLRNVLNFQEFNAQTVSSMGRRRDREMTTEPPVTNSIAGQSHVSTGQAAASVCTRWHRRLQWQ